MKEKLLKLAKMLIKFTITEVEDVKWVHEGEFIEGVEVYIEDENGDMQPVADGEYVKDNVKIVVKDGKIDSLEPVEEEPVEEPKEEPIEEPVEEPKEDERVAELEAKIADMETKIVELEGIIAGKDELIETLTTENEELRKQLDKPLEEPVQMNATPREKQNTDNKALKYFQN